MSEQVNGQLTLYPVDSPANPFPWLESKREKKMIVTSGRRCSGLSESCARIASSVRMYLESSRLPPGKWSRIWNAQAITSSCSILKLRLSELGTGGQGCSSPASQMWPTPTVAGCTIATEKRINLLAAGKTTFTSNQGVHGGVSNLREHVLARTKGLWPTPKASDSKGSGPAGSKSAEHDLMKNNLKGIVMYTMPVAADAQGLHGGENCRSLRTDVAGQLNPTWVEWLMGFPPGWTDLNASETR